MNIRTGVVKLIDPFGLPRWKHYAINLTTFRSLLVLWLPMKVTYYYCGNRIPVINVSQREIEITREYIKLITILYGFRNLFAYLLNALGFVFTSWISFTYRGFEFSGNFFFLNSADIEQNMTPLQKYCELKKLLGFFPWLRYIYIYI